MLKEILNEFNTPVGERAKIRLAKVERWMKAEDAETLGATYVFLCDAEQVARVTPTLSFDAVFVFFIRYYEFCLTHDPKSEWANSAYSAGWDLVGWFVYLWDEKSDRKYFQEIKAMLARLYVTGQPFLKKCIEHAIIEHLFERAPIRKFFRDWRDNPQLRPAYDEGMLWIKGGGWSPLTDHRTDPLIVGPLTGE